MSGALLETKLHAPPPRRTFVARPRLLARLAAVADARLTVVSAPPGFGKSTLLADWLRTPGQHLAAAWLSLDPVDGDPNTYWPYVVAAIRTALPTVGASALERLSDGATEAALSDLINELAAAGRGIALVLDDYHVVDGPAIQADMAFLLEHLPSNVHLVLTTRADPGLPLARLRARSELLEIRAADLRFTAAEAATYLTEAMGLNLTESQVEALETRTEGWIAALQLAAVSMQGRSDIASFVRGFSGDDRFVVDYLADEVLRRQGADVRAFLIETSVVARLNASLCNAVTGRDDAKAMLERLDRENLLVIPLDTRRDWYRYHRLFADVLGAHLREESPDRIPLLHHRASVWFEAHGEQDEAIRHAIAGGDPERAADLIERAIPDLRRARRESALRKWVEALPDELVRGRPALDLIYAGALLAGGRFEGVEERLNRAEEQLELSATRHEGAPAALGREQPNALASTIVTFRAALARARGDEDATIRYAEAALALATDGDHLARSGAAGFLGLTYWARGDLPAAEESWSRAAESLRLAGHTSDQLGCLIAIGDIRRTRGRLRAAIQAFEGGLQVGDNTARKPVRGAGDMHVGLAALCVERGDLGAAAQHLDRNTELGERLGLPQNAYRSRVAMAALREARGELAGSLELLHEAERVYDADFFPNVRPVAAMRARISLKLGDVARAIEWAHHAGVSDGEELSYRREFEHVTFARILAAQWRLGDSAAKARLLALLDRLLESAERGGRDGTVIEVLALQALAFDAAGNRTGAEVSLGRALQLAAPEGQQRTFLGEGNPLTRILQRMARMPERNAYVDRLLAASSEGGPSWTRQPLLEPLSERELEVLWLLATELDGPEIANELVVSLNTVRTHTKNIYAKLGVGNRRAAVRRAGELDLLPRSRG